MRILGSLVALLILVPSAAQAEGWYFSEGAGGVKVRDQLGHFTDSGPVLRLALGYRFDQIAVEGFAQGALLPTERGNSWYGLGAAGVDARYVFALGPHSGLYLHGGVAHFSLDAGYNRQQDRLWIYHGPGVTVGAGFQASREVPLLALLVPILLFTDYHEGPQIMAALWIETSQSFVRFNHDEEPYGIDAQLSQLTLGFGFGQDF